MKRMNENECGGKKHSSQGEKGMENYNEWCWDSVVLVTALFVLCL